MIGRGAECDLQVQDPSVSSRHCEVQFVDGQWTLVDLNSRNGIRVNGEVIKSHVLQTGDMILVGSSLRLRFCDLHQKLPTTLATRLREIGPVVVAVLLVTLLAVAAWVFW